MTGPDLIGWAASAILMATLVRQIVKQWHAEHTEAVSTWLFVGQMAASVLFVTYSALLHNRVFVVTNVLILLTAVVGQALSVIKRRRDTSTVHGEAPGPIDRANTSPARGAPTTHSKPGSTPP